MTGFLCCVDYHTELSNFYASYARLVRLAEYLGKFKELIDDFWKK